MSTFHLLVVIVCAFALVKETSSSTSTSSSTKKKECVCSQNNPKKCCKGLTGSTTAPAQYPDKDSPAGGPKNNTNAVVCYFYRQKGCLICTKGDKTAMCCTAGTGIQDDTKQGGPTPLNEYLIGERYTHGTHNIDWYNLYPRKNKDAYYGYNEPTVPGGRFAMGLHPGTISEGCVTVLDKDECWKKIKAVVEAGSLTYKGSDYSGFLYVL